jgi:uncharacterized protein YukE
MPEPDLDVRSQTMRTAATTFASEGPALSGALTKLRNTLDGLGEPWGDDDPGHAFGKDYKPNAEALLTALSSLAVGLTSISDGLNRMGGNYDGSDEASTIPGS